MTCDTTPEEAYVLGKLIAFRLWTRPAIEPDHWTMEAAGGRSDIELFQSDLTRAFPGLETLILPASEYPCAIT